MAFQSAATRTGYQMANNLVDLEVREIATVKKGANAKRIFLKKADDTVTDKELLEKAAADAVAAKAALEKAEADSKAQLEKIASLEAAASAAAEAASAERAALEKAQADAVAKAADLEAKLAVEKEAKEVAAAVAKASEDFKNLPEKAEVLGPALRAIRKADAKSADVLEAILKKVDVIAASALGAKGTAQGEDKAASALDEIQKAAEQLVKEGVVKSVAAGFDHVLSTNKKLYDEYTKERARR